ncbi:hypothetical protein MRX96_017953 [Rhipicephalus microplus]
MECSGSRSVLPYVLSFLTTRYWSQRVGYNVTVQEICATAPPARFKSTVYCGLVELIGGPENLLLVVIDIEVHPGDSVKFALGDGRLVEVLGKSTRAAPASDPNIHDTVVDAWIGGQLTGGTPPGRQRDAYEALAMLNSLVGTRGVFDSALNIATELSRAFFLGGGVANNGQDSYGLSCLGYEVASGKRFGSVTW